MKSPRGPACRFPGRYLLVRFILAMTCLWLSGVEGADTGYLGSETCRTCHAVPYENWRKSHHYQAMLPATEDSVVGDFDDTSFEYGGKTHRFYRREGKYFAFTDNASGEMEEFEIQYVFGFFPLQQYLVGFPDGRFQALSIAWDSRPATEGGEHWYHLYPDDAVDHDDILHWTGSLQNWNNRCAACHSTDLQKNYHPEQDTYETRWAEINVGCESCHGPGAAHVDWARGNHANPDPGFANAVEGRGTWVSDASRPTLRREDAGHAQGQIETCGACHSRRSEIAKAQPGKPFNDLFSLRLLEEDLYYSDGQIREEVYEYGSFLQSRMFEEGVACTDCHEPHNGALRSEGNGLCAQCHQPAVFDQPGHHHHENGSSGAACVNCHMPATSYMGVDARRDHSFRVPEPQLTVDFDIPNACNRCHEDKEAAWALAAVEGWRGTTSTSATALRASHAPLFHAARLGQPDALPGLIALANDSSRPGIIRATAVLESRRFPSRETVALLQQRVEDEDALVRAAAASAMDWLPLSQRYTLLQPLITDPAKSVRMTVATALADLSPNQISANGRDEWVALRTEYVESLETQADMPEAQMNLGNFLARSGQAEEAERAYRRALKLSPRFVPAMVNLADLYRENGMDPAAKTLLQNAIELEPGLAAPRHALGLLLVRERKADQALAELQKAAELEPGNARYAYVYGVALYGQGKQQEAVDVLEAALQRHPHDAEVVSALLAYYHELGEVEKLRALEAKQPPR